MKYFSSPSQAWDIIDDLFDATEGIDARRDISHDDEEEEER